MNNYNRDILENIFNWFSISDLSEIEIRKIADKLNFQLDDQFLFKCTWSYYRKCTVFSLNRVPQLFLKYIRENYIQELLALHLTKYFFDPELCFNNYLTGFFQNKNKQIPYIATTYEMGDHIGRYDINEFRYLLGRQCYLHEILCLYDVYERHFIVRNRNSLCRIDFGRAFENLHKNYLGFLDFLKKIRLDPNDKEFQDGYKFEMNLIRENLEKDNKIDEIICILSHLRNLKEDQEMGIPNMEKFCKRLANYWERIDFIRELNLIPL